MVRAGVVHYLHCRVDGAGFGIVRTVNQAPDARMNHGSRAHRARLNCNKQIAVSQPMVSDSGTRLSQRNDLGVRGWVEASDVVIEAAPNNLALVNHDRAHRDFSGLQRTLRGAQRFLHPELVGLRLVGLKLASGLICAQVIFPSRDSSSSNDSTRGKPLSR
jgi:hypothetical protein